MRIACCTAALALVFAASVPAAAQMPAPPTPGPEHAVFKAEEGTWDASIEMTAPGAPAMPPAKGVQVDTVGCGGLCLTTEVKAELMPGMPFEGRGLTTYDPAKKKYIGSWTDSMAPGLSLSEGTYDAATHKSTSWMESPDMTGKMTKTKSVTEQVDADHKVMTMFTVGDDGKEMPTMKISYTRKK
jgi:hypothetical protein